MADDNEVLFAPLAILPQTDQRAIRVVTLKLNNKVLRDTNGCHLATQFLKHPAKTPWQEKFGLRLAICKTKILSVDIERIAFRPSGIVTKNVTKKCSI